MVYVMARMLRRKSCLGTKTRKRLVLKIACRIPLPRDVNTIFPLDSVIDIPLKSILRLTRMDQAFATLNQTTPIVQLNVNKSWA